MGKKIISCIVLSMLLICTVSVSSSPYIHNILYVDDDGTADYTTIQEAVNAASEGDTIYVYNGVYQENVLVGKSLTLTGEYKQKTVIDGRNADNVITIMADNVQISGFSITNGKIFNAGISVFRADDTIISDCIIYENNGIGIELDLTSGATISECIVSSNAQYGVVIYSYDGVRPNSNNNVVTKCYIFDNEVGIFLDDTTGNSIIKNCVTENDKFGIHLAYASDNKIKENDFIENNINAFFQGMFRNYWSQNYWDKSFHLQIKMIVGSVFLIPWLNVDWQPSFEPNTIFFMK